jgi:precorrin-6B methylase 1
VNVRGGRLTVVGTGIDVTTQLAPGAQAAIRAADTVFYLLADPLAALRVEALNPQARSLDSFYGPGKDRRVTYGEIVETVVTETLAARDVCLVTYGHPGVFASAGHEAVARVRSAGLPAQMLPAISALDCLYADLGIDPGRAGLQAYEASYFFAARPPIDTRAILVLLQVGMLGEAGGTPTGASAARFPLLADLLRELYGQARRCLLYEASPYPGVEASIIRFVLADTDLPRPSVLATLCVLPE